MMIGSKGLVGLMAAVCVSSSLSVGCAASEEETGSSASAAMEVQAPSMVYPQQGQTVGLAGSYMFKVAKTWGSQGTLCSLWQNGVAIWENYANDGVLGQNGECAIHPDHPLHRQFKAGTAHFMARDLVNGQWTDAREIDIQLRAGRPAMQFPVNGQQLDLGGSYIFKLRDSQNTEGTLCSIWQNGRVVWENYASDRVLGQNGECGLHPDNPAHGLVQTGAARFMGRYLVHGQWSDAVEIDLQIR
jgi:hypothetical protein